MSESLLHCLAELGRWPTKAKSTSQHNNRLSLLKKKGFNPKVIYDIGAFQGDWSREIHKVFPEANFFLFEANELNRQALEQQPFAFCIALLGNEAKEVLYHCLETPNTGDSIFCENSPWYSEGRSQQRPVQMHTLASIVEGNQLPLPDLIKIDAQGAEKLIIEGSPQILCQAEAVILETKILEYNLGAPLGHELIALMVALGYRVADILEWHYLPSGELNEVDYLFIKRNSNLIPKNLF